MDDLNSDIPLNDTGNEIELGAPLRKARTLAEWESERTRSLSIGMRFRKGGTSLR
jgi:hypothetical protein